MRMRRASSLVVAASLVSLAAVGCSLLTSLDGLSGGPSTEASDATTTPTDAPPMIDGGMPEAGGSDSPITPADSGEAGVVDPCATAVFCDHFERTDVQGAWDSAFTDNGGTEALDTSTFTSPTRSLALHVPVSPTTGDPHAQLASPRYDNVAHARVSFSMKVGAPDRMMSLMRMQLTQSSTAAEVFDLFMLPGKVVADEQLNGVPNTYFNYEVKGFVPDVWQRWSMELDARGAVAVGIVTLDGTEVIHTTLNNAFKTGAFSVLLGAFYAPSGPAHDIFFDDVAITILP